MDDPLDRLRTYIPEILQALEETSRRETLARGRAYEDEGRARIVELSPTHARGEVIGTDEAPYDVTLRWEPPPVESLCSCPAWGSWDDHCKHAVALALSLDRAARSDTESLRAALAPRPLPSEQSPPGAGELSALRDWLGIPREPMGLVYDLSLHEGLSVGVLRSEKARGRTRCQSAQALLRGSALDPADRRVLAALSSLPRDAGGRYLLSPMEAGGVLETLRGRNAVRGTRHVSFALYPAYLLGALSQDDSARTLTLRLRLSDGTLVALEGTQLLSAVPPFVLLGDTLHRLETVAPFDQLTRFRAEPAFRLPRDDAHALDLALVGLRRFGVVLDVEADLAPEPPHFTATFDGDPESVRVLLAVRYGDVELPLTTAGATTHVTTDGRLVRRDPAAEALAIEALERAGLSRAGDGAFTARDDRAVDFWTRGALALPGEWSYFGPKPQAVVRLRPLRPSVSLRQAATGWFTLDVAFVEQDQSVDLERLRPLLASGRRYATLSDGSVGELPRELAEQVRGLLEETGAEPKGSALTLAPFEAGAVERLLDLVPEAQVAPDSRRYLAALRHFTGIDEVELPPGLKAELRPYQKRGLDWLCFLHRYGLSGVLADDMGLGKTVQALSLLLRLKKDEGRAPSLVVAPTSVLPNWEREAARFAPSLKVLMYDGPDREARRDAILSADLVLTSYAILRRDVAPLQKLPFRYVILDEAQHIKNPGSQGAKAARALPCERRLALTGTPLENRLSELWSLFDFLMPGFLGTEVQFRNRYARPIEMDGNAGVRDRLKRRVHPFMLRRLKDEVARELPPRTDAVVPVELSAGQQVLYREMLATAKSRVSSIIASVGFKRAHVSILSELLRLRQVCCDPRLLKLPPGTRLPPSAKLEAFGELVRDLVGEGHRALIFSQFTEMLGHLTRWAEEEGLRFEYLDGQTKDRQERIDRFQTKDGAPLFFISLKAGGTGLNLTAADYIIHFDPWWNPAVEQQAIDRAHRIGQTKPVFSYKLIAKGTVEEKILSLQQRKKGLAAGILASDDEVGKVLTEKDVRELFE
jgi:superfamily II DNA or RNA helicase